MILYTRQLCFHSSRNNMYTKAQCIRSSTLQVLFIKVKEQRIFFLRSDDEVAECITVLLMLILNLQTS